MEHKWVGDFVEYNVKKNIANELTKWFDNNPNVTKKAFAEKFGVSSTSVIRWISEENAPTIELIPQICDYIGISIDQFLGHTSVYNESEKKLLDMYRNDESFKVVVDKLLK